MQRINLTRSEGEVPLPELGTVNLQPQPRSRPAPRPLSKSADPRKLLTVLKHHDVIPRISAETMREILQGQWSETYERVFVVDCRYLYEFEGGHITVAINLKSSDMLKEIFLKEPGQT